MKPDKNLSVSHISISLGEHPIGSQGSQFDKSSPTGSQGTTQSSDFEIDELTNNNEAANIEIVQNEMIFFLIDIIVLYGLYLNFLIIVRCSYLNFIDMKRQNLPSYI
ncbi:MAG: hypothetical protein LBP59_05855 [Planctomycetaceae bacterium]|nr:hypothetical protein [Planctomycetaceae bacterium]